MIPRVTSLLRQRSTRRLPAFFASLSPSRSLLSTTTLAAPTQRPSALSSMRRSRFAFSIHHKAEVGLCPTATVPGRAYATSSSNNGSDTEGPTLRGQGEDEPDGALHTTMPWVTAEEEEAAAAATAAMQSPLASSAALASGPDIPDTDVQARASGSGDGCDSAAGFGEGGIGAAECSSHVVPQSIDTESASLHDMAETLLGDDAGIDTSSSQRLHHPPSDPSTPSTAAEESTTQALASEDPASMIPPSSEQLTSTPEGAKASAPLSPWDDNGVGLVRRRVAQWYVPGLEREHRQLHGPPGTRDTAAPTVKLSEVMSEVVSVALKGTGNPADHTGLQPRSKRDGAAASVPQDTQLEGTASAAEYSATASALGEAGAAQTNPVAAAASADRDGASVSSTPATATPPSSSSSPSTASSSAAGASGKESHKETQQRSEKAGSTPQQAAAPVNAAEDDEEDADADQDEELPETLLTVQANRNKRLKRALIAGLGSDFAKAGLSNDGVRTSFSVVNYQTIKQLTGLHRIPSTLLMSCLVAPENEFSWIDISMHPTATLSEYKEALEEVLLGLGMHRTMVEDSAEPMLLPQVTVTKGCYSLLMRYAIEAPANKQMDSFQDLTNRFTVFLSQKRIITVHRTQCSYVEELKLNWLHYLSGGGAHDAAANAHRVASGFFTADGGDSHHFTPRGMQYLLYYFVKETIGTFTQAIAKCIVEFDRYEANLFSTQRNRSSMAREIYHIKRRASVYGRTLTLTQDAYAHIASALQISSSQVGYQEIMHDLAHVESLAEELNSNADSVLQLLFQLSSYQVNELMRVLTLFSAFFIPLSFIASVYGMNFENLPMLHSDYGGVFCAVLMLTVATGIFLWFRVNRFI